MGDEPPTHEPGLGALRIDVVDPRLLEPVGDDELRVFVEPLYGCVAVAVALDAGWGSVEVAGPAAGAPPIPLVSFELPPGVDQHRCRVRSGAISRGAAAGMLLGAPVNARPLGSRLAAAPVARVTFVPALAGDPGELAADAWWASGMLVRVLLDELDRDSRLTDAAGIAVSLAQGAEPAAAALGTGARWDAHLAAGGHADDLRVATAIDTVGVIPVLAHDGDALVATPW